MNTQAFDVYGLIVILFLAVVAPLVGIWDMRRLERWLEEGRRNARIATYWWIIGIEWAMTGLFAGWWLLDGRGLDGIGLVWALDGWQWLAAGLGLAATAFVIAQMVLALRDPEQLRQLREQAGSVAEIGPVTPAESRLFGGVSVTAGVCEEIVYRGVLMAVLMPVTGLWPAVALSSLIFGLGHIYQGLVGVVKTAGVGLVMALLTVFTGSILVPIVLHAVIDLTSGRMLAASNQHDALSNLGQGFPSHPA